VELIASGRDADVWALDGERVLRRYRDGRDMDREAAVLRHAAAHGYPVPRVYGTEPGAMVLERLYGPTMLAALLAGSMAASAAGTMLGDLLIRPEWALHPAVGDDEARTVDQGWRVRASDYDFLTSPETRRLLAEQQIIVTDYLPLQQAARAVNQKW